MGEQHISSHPGGGGFEAAANPDSGRAFPIPRNLQEARFQMMQLPGMETHLGNEPGHYEPIDEQHYLSLPERPRTQEEIDTRLDRAASLVFNQVYAEQAVKEIAHNLAWSQADYHSYLERPDTAPFKGPIELAQNREALKQQLAMCAATWSIAIAIFTVCRERPR